MLSLLVIAKPLVDKVDGYAQRNDLDGYLSQDAVKRHQGHGPYRGLLGDVFLASTPVGARLDDIKVNTSVRKGEIGLDVAVRNLAEGKNYTLNATVSDHDKVVKTFDPKSITAADVVNGRVTVAWAWKPEKLWDLNTPENQYDLKLSLVDAGDAGVLDEFRPVRFGFREFWLDGRDFYLNGTRVFSPAIFLDNGVMNTAAADYEHAAESFRRLRKAGINTVYTHNYDCLPGVHLSYEELLRAADDVGMLVSFSVPHNSSYNWPYKNEDAAKTNGYMHDMEFYIRVAQNHPSVVMYSANHNATAYSEDQNPELLDGVWSPWPDKENTPGVRTDNAAVSATRSEEIIHLFDTTRAIYHHSSGNLNQMYTLNNYLDFVPVQERSDWFEHWATKGIKPLFLVEYGLPLDENWSNWRDGHQIFGVAMLFQFFFPEWGAQFRGDAAYDLPEPDKTNIRFEAENWRNKKTWSKGSYPVFGRPNDSPNLRVVDAMYVHDNWPAFRTWGVTAFAPWPFDCFWKLRDGLPTGDIPCKTDWNNLQKPGYSADFYRPRVRYDLAFEEKDWIPQVSGEVFLRYNRPLLSWLAGKPESFTSKDHNFHPGDTIAKQAIIVNNSRVTTVAHSSWQLADTGIKGELDPATVETGQQTRQPISFKLPDDIKPGSYELSLTTKFDTGETQTDTLVINVLAKTPKPAVAAKIALYDPEGETAKLLTNLGIAFEKVEANAGLAGYDLVIVGRNALTPYGPGPDVSRVSQGLKVVVFEQSRDTLEKRLGFRTQEYVLRRVFARVPDHPVLAGLASENLHDWQGAGTILPAFIPRTFINPRSYLRLDWAGYSVRHPWRAGCQGSVASLLMEKPACGNFLSIVDGGFGLQYAPLMECRDGRGMILFCQMDVTARTENDPAAERLVSNILSYASSYKPQAARQALYVGDPAGKKHLESAGLTVSDYNGGALKADQVLIVAPGGDKVLAPQAQAVDAWLKAGGRLLAFGLDQDEANSFLPFKVTMNKAEHIGCVFAAPGLDSAFAGVSPANVYSRDPRELPLITEGAEILGDGIIAKARDANVVFCQLLPWTFDYKAQNGQAWMFNHRAHNIKPTFRNASILVSRLLANMGVASSTPMAKRIHEPALEGMGVGDLAEALWLECDGKQVIIPTAAKGIVVRRKSYKDAEQGPEGWNTVDYVPQEADAWRNFRLPGIWDDQYEDTVMFGGAVFYRVNFTVPDALAGKAATLYLGEVEDEDTTYINGTLINKTVKSEKKNEGKIYEVPEGLLKAGQNLLALKVRNGGWTGGVAPLVRHPRQMERLEHILDYLPAECVRYADGLYLDAPEYYDDPYRYYRW